MWNIYIYLCTQLYLFRHALPFLLAYLCTCKKLGTTALEYLHTQKCINISVWYTYTYALTDHTTTFWINVSVWYMYTCAHTRICLYSFLYVQETWYYCPWVAALHIKYIHVCTHTSSIYTRYICIWNLYIYTYLHNYIHTQCGRSAYIHTHLRLVGVCAHTHTHMEFIHLSIFTQLHTHAMW